MTLVALDEIHDAGRWVGQLQVAAAPQLLRHVLGDVPGPAFRNGLETRRNTVTTALLQEVGEKANRLNLALTPLSQFLTWYRAELNPPPADIRIV